MNYQEEIINMVRSITQESILQFFYSLLRVAASDPEGYERLLSEACGFTIRD